MQHRRLQWYRAISAALIVAAGAWACAQVTADPNAWEPDTNLPECPRGGEWSLYFKDKRFAGMFGTSGLLSVPGRLTDVPEFHDCQRFLSKNATPAFLSLFAVFARDSAAHYTARFDSVPVGHSSISKADSERVKTYGAPLPVVEVFAPEQGYGTLGIAPGFNCVFLFWNNETISGLEARMLAVGKNEKRCVQPFNPATDGGLTLEVKRHHVTGASPPSYPPVARWDWDGTNRTPYIGTACGNAWCEIGPVYATGVHFASSAPQKPSIVSPNDHVLAVKGWYDQQRLAFPKTGGGPPALPNVGNIIGTFTPDPALGSDTGDPETSRFKGHWIQVATADIDGPSTLYFTKLNLEKPTAGTAKNNVLLCYGKGTACFPAGSTKVPTCPAGVTAGWWARIISANTLTVSTFCVHRREHPGIRIPGVVRWRWAVNDETMWIRCLEGCCEVETGTKIDGTDAA